MANQLSDEAMFSSILKSMGIQNYDPLVITALNEYARRYAGNLLSDAKDYAKHADRQVNCGALLSDVSFKLLHYPPK